MDKAQSLKQKLRQRIHGQHVFVFYHKKLILRNGTDRYLELWPVYEYNINSMHIKSMMILQSACIEFQCIKLLHERLQISKIVKLSRCKYIKILPGFYIIGWQVHTCLFCCSSAETTMTGNYCMSNSRLELNT